MLGRIGFCEKWISWIKACLESTLMSILVNGNPTKEFIPKKGLKQGDPLAPKIKSVFNIKVMLNCFELPSSLKVNFSGWSR